VAFESVRIATVQHRLGSVQRVLDDAYLSVLQEERRAFDEFLAEIPDQGD